MHRIGLSETDYNRFYICDGNNTIMIDLGRFNCEFSYNQCSVSHPIGPQQILTISNKVPGFIRIQEHSTVVALITTEGEIFYV